MTESVAWNPNTNSLEPKNLTELMQQSGIDNLVGAFITAESGQNCKGAWGGFPEYPATKDNPWGLATISHYISHGGKFTISFGGAAGVGLQESCTDANNLAQILSDIGKAYDITSFDFDIEGAAITDTVAITKLATALQQLKKNNPAYQFSLTLPVLQTGLTADGLNVLKTFQKAGLNPRINIMAMDFGGPVPEMGDAAIQAAANTAKQMMNIFNISSEEAYKRLIVTPMIGQNDIQGEIYNTSNAQQLKDFSDKIGLGGISYWSFNRDYPCSTSTNSNTCSGTENGENIQSKSFEFGHTFYGIPQQSLKKAITKPLKEIKKEKAYSKSIPKIPCSISFFRNRNLKEKPITAKVNASNSLKYA